MTVLGLLKGNGSVILYFLLFLTYLKKKKNVRLTLNYIAHVHGDEGKPHLVQWCASNLFLMFFLTTGVFDTDKLDMSGFGYTDNTCK